MQRVPALSRPQPIAAAAQLDMLQLGRRALGLVLLFMSTVPLYRWLSDPHTGLAGASTVQLADSYREFGTSVLLLTVAVAIVLARFWPAVEHGVAKAGAVLAQVPAKTFALLCALLAGAAALAFSIGALHGEPTLIDATTQLMQARYWAAGQLAGPANDLGAFWHLQQSLNTPAGWVSQYPPGHVALLALGYQLGAVVLVGPLMLAVAVFFSARAMQVLYPEQRAAARLGGLLVALSPFLTAHAGAFMNHTSAAACIAFGVYSAASSRFRGRGLVLTGTALGALATIRPLTAVTVGIVLLVFVLLQPRTTLRAVSWLLLGAIPFVIALGAYNAHFFGSPLRFGYEAALGPAGALGFGLDPWGNVYGLKQAVAYTAAELSTLNLLLLETAVPAVVVVALFALLAQRLQTGDRLLLALVAAPLVTHLLYWHHGLFMGPRMLNEYAPLWCLLFARAATRLPFSMPDASFAGFTPRGLVGASLLVGSVAMIGFAPMRLWSYATPRSSAQEALASVTAPALVFVHGGWEDRIGMRLAAGGMRLDSVETLIRQNPTCAAQLYADARASGQAVPQLDFQQRAINLPERRAIGPGSVIRAGAEPWTAECNAQAQSDRAGVIDPSRLFLHGDLPSGTDGAIVARDLGPRLNDALIQRYPGRPVFLLHARADGRVALDPYSTGSARLWSSAAGVRQ